jgi:hypothetical protein
MFDGEDFKKQVENHPRSGSYSSITKKSSITPDIRESLSVNILVTGYAGFIGSYLIEAFLAEGLKVFILVALLTGKESNLCCLTGR